MLEFCYLICSIGSMEDLMASRGVVMDFNVVPDCQGRDDEKVDGDSTCANSEQQRGIVAFILHWIVFVLFF